MLGPPGYHTVRETKAHGVADVSYHAGSGPQLFPLVPTTEAVLCYMWWPKSQSPAVRASHRLAAQGPPHKAETQAEAADGRG